MVTTNIEWNQDSHFKVVKHKQWRGINSHLGMEQHRGGTERGMMEDNTKRSDGTMKYIVPRSRSRVC
jgi:hypothetical protein